MSQGEKVEFVRRTYAEWQRGNMKAGVERFHPKVVFETFMPDTNERVVVNGPDGVEEFMREFLEQWRDYRLFGDEYRQVGATKVFVEGHQTAAGRQSGVAVEDTMFSVWTFSDDKVIYLLFDRDRGTALEAAGLRE
jgi:ketosteroid isomerase-like protein